jgi:hypothetical protein
MKKLVAALTTAIFAVALVVVGAAAPASAHTPGISGVATCTSDGTYTVTWTYTTIKVPSTAEASTKVTAYSPTSSTLTTTDGVGKGTSIVLSTYSNAPIAGVQTRKGNFTATLTQTGIAGTSTSASVTVHSDWNDGASGDATSPVTLDGKCGYTPPPAGPSYDATASVSTTDGTCTAAGTLVLGTLKNATWEGQPSYNGSTYTVVAKADDNHLFKAGTGVSADGTTDTFTGTLPSQLASNDPKCAPATPPVCIPASAVSYTYSPTVTDNVAPNNGVITVKDVPNSTGKLCEAFYVTAVAWSYTHNNNAWPQHLTTVHDYYIDSPGTYPYGATVNCGQGDIYAATAAAGQPTPPQTLNGPGTPWPEHFLHDMGFSGPTPTYTQTSTSCLTAAPTTGAPTLDVETCKAGSANTLDLPAVNGGVWTVTSGTNKTVLPIGTGKNLGAVFGIATYTITLADGDSTDAYDVTAAGSPWTWTPVELTAADCETVVPVVTPTAHPITSCGTTGSIDIPASTADVKYELKSGDGHTGENVVLATALGDNVFSKGPPAVTTETFTFDLGQPTQCITLNPGTPTATDQSCVNGNLNGGFISVQNETGLVFEVTGGPAAAPVDYKNVVGQTPALFPGTYTVTVTIDKTINPNYVFADGQTTSWTLPVNAAVDCRTITASATSTAGLCQATPNGATPQTYVPGFLTVAPFGDPDVTFAYSSDGGTTWTPITSATTNVDPGSYLIQAQLTTAASAAGVALPVSQWGPFSIAAVDCTTQTAAVTPPDASSCTNQAPNNTPLINWIHLTATPNVTYTATNKATNVTTPLVDGYNDEAIGDYTVTATADNGYKLDAAGDLSQTFDVTVADTTNCLTTGATWHAGASADPAVCSAQNTQVGTIHLRHLASEIGKVTYTITNDATGVTINAGSHATIVHVAPGTYTVHAKAVPKGDGLSTASVFPRLLVAAASVACGGPGGLLAFTGVPASLGIAGILLAVSMMFLGLAAIFIRRGARRTN